MATIEDSKAHRFQLCVLSSSNLKFLISILVQRFLPPIRENFQVKRLKIHLSSDAFSEKSSNYQIVKYNM